MHNLVQQQLQTGTIFSLSWHYHTMRCYSIVTQYNLEKILLFDLAFLSLLCIDYAVESCRPCPFVYIYSPSVDFYKKLRENSAQFCSFLEPRLQFRRSVVLTKHSKYISKPLVSSRAVKC